MTAAFVACAAPTVNDTRLMPVVSVTAEPLYEPLHKNTSSNAFVSTPPTDAASTKSVAVDEKTTLIVPVAVVDVTTDIDAYRDVPPELGVVGEAVECEINQ